MSNLRQAAQQALEALYEETAWFGPTPKGAAAITALRAALAEPVQEPVAWMYRGIRHDGTPHDRPSLIWRPEYMDAISAEKGAKATPLYTAPPQRESPSPEALLKAEDQRDALLEFTRGVVRYAGNSCDDYLADKARVAIAKAESTK